MQRGVNLDSHGHCILSFIAVCVTLMNTDHRDSDGVGDVCDSKAETCFVTKYSNEQVIAFCF